MKESKKPQEDLAIPLQDMSEQARKHRKEIKIWIENSMATLKKAQDLMLALKKRLREIETEIRQGGDLPTLLARQELIASKINEIDTDLKETGLEHRISVRTKELRDLGGPRFLKSS